MKRTNNYGQVNVVLNDNNQYGVTDNDGNIIVPFGKYGWISGFDNGLARVHSTHVIIENPKWGIIDMGGNEVLPLLYDNIWNFLGKNRMSTKVILAGNEFWFHFKNKELLSYNPDRVNLHNYNYGRDENDYEESYGNHYGEFAGSYAQNVMGYSDDVIYDAFEGDPDAYWNID